MEKIIKVIWTSDTTTEVLVDGLSQYAGSGRFAGLFAMGAGLLKEESQGLLLVAQKSGFAQMAIPGPVESFRCV
jgi:hypothetical protein